MPQYRRNRVPGGTYFFTVNLHDRKQRLLVEHIDALRDAVRAVRAERPFRLVAWVVLPEHMHAIWTLPPGDCDYSGRWQAIKARFTKTIGGCVLSFPAAPDKRGRGIWQPRFWEHTIRDEADLKTHLDYVHVNPLKHRLVERVREWPHSSFRHYLARGLYSADWAGGQEPDPAPVERRA